MGLTNRHFSLCGIKSLERFGDLRFVPAGRGRKQHGKEKHRRDRAGRANKVRSKLLIKRMRNSDAIGKARPFDFVPASFLSSFITHASYSYLLYTASPCFSLPQHIHLLLLFKARCDQLFFECHSSSDHRDSQQTQSDPVYGQTPRSIRPTKTTTSLEDSRAQPSTWVSTMSQGSYLSLLVLFAS